MAEEVHFPTEKLACRWKPLFGNVSMGSADTSSSSKIWVLSSAGRPKMFRPSWWDGRIGVDPTDAAKVVLRSKTIQALDMLRATLRPVQNQYGPSFLESEQSPVERSFSCRQTWRAMERILQLLRQSKEVSLPGSRYIYDSCCLQDSTTTCLGPVSSCILGVAV